jgi:Uma2 family endonuclease
MVQAPQKTITLDEFLQLPETKPASEYIKGAIVQKPMPQGKHSTIQGELITRVNAAGKPQRIAWAFPELRCTFGERSIVPEVAILVWNRIPLDADGEIANTFNAHPDWTIEILSPAPSQTKVTNNILHCLNAGCQMGWLLDRDEKNILAYPARQQPISLQEPTDILPMPNFMPEMQLTLGEVFGWLKPGNI